MFLVFFFIYQLDFRPDDFDTKRICTVICSFGYTSAKPGRSGRPNSARTRRSPQRLEALRHKGVSRTNCDQMADGEP